MKFKEMFLASVIITAPMTFTISSLEMTNIYAQGVSADWATPAVTAMNDAGLLPNSLKDDKDYKENISREEYAELITTYYSAVRKQTSLPAASESKFSDTNNPLILLANKLGIVGGYPDGTFKPQNNIPKKEIAVMSNQAEKQLTNIKQTSNVSQFKDGEQIASWSKESVGSLATAGGIGGYPDKTFKPTNKMTKQEAISLVSNLAGKAGLIAKAPVVVAPPVTGQTVEQAQALYTQTLAQYPVTREGGVDWAKDVKSFQVVEKGTPFVVNGVTINKVNLTYNSTDNSTTAKLEQDGTSKSVDVGASFYYDGSYGKAWMHKDGSYNKGWWLGSNIKPEDIKAVMFNDGYYGMTLVKLK